MKRLRILTKRSQRLSIAEDIIDMDQEVNQTVNLIIVHIIAEAMAHLMALDSFIRESIWKVEIKYPGIILFFYKY
jgi:hypothetical protein